jgi:hypothetical protein
MKNQFAEPSFYEHTIADEHGKIIGHIRVKPSGVSWKKVDGKKWYGVTLAHFAEWIVANGTLKDH